MGDLFKTFVCVMLFLLCGYTIYIEKRIQDILEQAESIKIMTDSLNVSADEVLFKSERIHQRLDSIRNAGRGENTAKRIADTFEMLHQLQTKDHE